MNKRTRKYWLRADDPIQAGDFIWADGEFHPVLKTYAKFVGRTRSSFSIDFSVARATSAPKRIRPKRPYKSVAGPDGPGSRKDKWETINWDNTDAAIGDYMGVHKTAARHQRLRRGKEPFAPRGGNTRNYTTYNHDRRSPAQEADEAADDSVSACGAHGDRRCD